MNDQYEHDYNDFTGRNKGDENHDLFAAQESEQSETNAKLGEQSVIELGRKQLNKLEQAVHKEVTTSNRIEDMRNENVKNWMRMLDEVMDWEFRDGKVTITTREISNLTRVRHDNILRTGRNVVTDIHGDKGSGAALKFEESYLDGNGRERPMLRLPVEYALTLIGHFNTELRHAVNLKYKQLSLQVRENQAPTESSDGKLVIDIDDNASLRNGVQVLFGKVIELNEEVEKLNDTCDNMFKHDATGQSVVQLCKQFNGVSVNQVQQSLADEGKLIKVDNYKEKGWKATSYTRDTYFKQQSGFYNDSTRRIYHVELTKKGGEWLAKKYFNNKLPMKKSWDGKFYHTLPEESEVEF